MKPYARSERVSGHLQRVLSELLQRQVKDPRLAKATITDVQLTRDLKIARIYFSVTGGKTEAPAVVKGFESARGFVKRTLAAELGLRYMPDLEFFYDESFDYGARINQVLKSLERENGSHPEPSEE
ncbi:MAG: 30S ribosome-binding factor RbfA [Desulfobacterales bacterium]|nr:30S ribosome-binding factor RbfA [Desulfobacterales bacterium]